MTNTERLQANNAELQECLNLAKNVVGGECTKRHVIELTETPKEGLIEGETYRVARKAFLSIALKTEEYFFIDFLGLLAAILGTPIPEGTYQYVKTAAELPAEGNVADSQFGAYAYVEDEDTIYVYDPETKQWEAGDMSDSDAPYMGILAPGEIPTELGMYIVVGEGDARFYELIPGEPSLLIVSDGEVSDFSEAFPLPHVIEIVPTRPTSPLESGLLGAYYLYYVEDEQDILYYESGAWQSMSEDEDYSVNGIITDISQATEEGVYLVDNTHRIVEYLHPSGTKYVTESGTYSVGSFANVKVTVPDTAVCGIRKLPISGLPTDAGIVDVNFTTTIEGKTVKCKQLYFEHDWFDAIDRLNYIGEDDRQYTIYDQMSGDYLGGSLYVDFGPVPQLVPKIVGEYLAQFEPVFEITPLPDINFTVDGAVYSARPSMMWLEFSPNYTTSPEGFHATSYAVYLNDKPIYYKDKSVTGFDIVIKEGAYRTTRSFTFSIVGTTHTADAGMTWNQWIESEYNANSTYMVKDGNVWNEDEQTYICLDGGSRVAATAVITEGYDYWFET